MMVTKCIRKHTLFIVILFVVQANDLVPHSFCSTTPPIPFPYSYEAGTREMHKCITDVLEECERDKTTWPLTDFGYQKCIHHGYDKCIHTLSYGYARRFKDCVFKTCKRARNKSTPYYRQSAQRVTCFLKCYEDHLKEFSDAIYIHIP